MARGADAGKGPSGRMKEAWKLYNAGDVVSARREARRLMAESPDEPDAEQARNLIERTEVPSFAWYLAVVAAALILAMIIIGIAHH